jgi:hypothetical protein
LGSRRMPPHFHPLRKNRWGRFGFGGATVLLAWCGLSWQEKLINRPATGRWRNKGAWSAFVQFGTFTE